MINFNDICSSKIRMPSKFWAKKMTVRSNKKAIHLQFNITKRKTESGVEEVKELYSVNHNSIMLGIS